MAEPSLPDREDSARPEHDRLMIWLWKSYAAYLDQIFDLPGKLDRRRIDATPLRLASHLSDTGLFADAIWELDFAEPSETPAVADGDSSATFSRRQRMLAVFEIRPSLSSLGEVLEGINRRHAVLEEIGAKAFVLVTDDARFDEVFTDQGVFVIHPGEDRVHAPAQGVEERPLDISDVDDRGG